MLCFLSESVFILEWHTTRANLGSSELVEPYELGFARKKNRKARREHQTETVVFALASMASIQDSGLFTSRKRRTGDIVDGLKQQENKRPFTAGGKNR